MAQRVCAAGFQWDDLLVICVRNKTMQKPEHHTGEFPFTDLIYKNASARAPSAAMEGPALWSCVVVVTLGSILALAVWFFIYRQQRRPTWLYLIHTAEPRRQAPAKQPPTERNRHTELFLGAPDAPSPCHHLHPEAQRGLKWGDGFTACGGPTVHSGGPSEHRIPLPATELGGTVLVTTKTM
uniref:Uncharacterized protein n=1 Tax=Salarias fasciatus TaxID=181472 RepID=A0A672GWM8_SALFA